jgi:hypothetical protein
VARQINALRAIGFDYFIISNATHGVAREPRHRMMRRFAEEVMPLVEKMPLPERAEMAPPAAE